MKTNSISAGRAVHAQTITTTRQLIFRRAWLWTGFLAFATIAFGPQPAQAAVTEAWVHRYSNVVSNVADEAVKVVRDAAGDIIVTGSTARGLPGADMLTIKYSGADGSVLWQQRYNGPANGHDQASALAVDGSGNVVVTGSSQRDSSYFSPEIYTAKYAATDGALLWEKRYSNGQATAVAVDGSGNVVVTGSSNDDYYTAKYAAADGALLWERRFSGPANSSDHANAVAVDGSGNVVVTGFSYYISGYSDYYTAKYAAADGALLWEKRYGAANSYGQATAVAVDGSGNVVVTGNSFSSSSSNGKWDYYTAKYAATDGALLWEKRYNGPANSDDEASALAVDGSGNVVVTGSSYSSEDYGSGDYYTAMYAAVDGALLWEKRFNGPASVGDTSPGLALGPDGMVAVTGNSNGGYATVVYREAVSIDLMPTGIRLRFTGVTGRSYNIERAPAVTGPWSTVNTQTAPASGLLEYLDTNSPAAAAFYRTSQQ